jgi:hypothetical protein
MGRTMILRHRKAAEPIIRFAIWFLLVAVCYRNTQSAFFRAESGWYQFLSLSNPRFPIHLLASRYQGHYTPLAFIGEFELSRLVGPHEFFWKWRQVTLLSVFATAISLFVSRLAQSSRISIVPAEALAWAITALYVFQTRMTDLVAWPFMVMQLEWLLLTMAALTALVQIAGGSTRVSWIWMAAACAYGSMHASGLGIATVGATGVAFLLLLRSDYFKVQNPTRRRQLATALAIMVIFAAIHGACMNWMPTADDIPPPVDHRIAIKPFLGFIWVFVLSVIRSLIGWDQAVADSAKFLSSRWPLGVVFLLASAFLLINFFRRMKHSSRPEQRIAFVLQVFSIMIFAGVLPLIIARQHTGLFRNQYYGLLTEPRYLVTISFALFGPLVVVALTAVRRARSWLSVPLLIGIGITAFAVNQHYAATVRPVLEPRSTISHERAWNLVVETAREARAAGLAVPNVPMRALTKEFDWDLKLFEPLLRSGLRLPPGEIIAFASWDVFAAGIPEEYAVSVPSLRPLIELMNLEPGRAR